MKEDKKNPLFIDGMNEEIKLIPVHINKARTDEYYYSWNSNNKGWMRGDKIDSHRQKLNKSPLVKSNYK